MNLNVADLGRRAVEWIFENYPEEAFLLYPPYLGAGIRVEEVAESFRRIEVSMPLRWYNRNYVGTQFGGSLYSMCDPFYMLMVMHNLGDSYVVWDKAAEVQFRKPGTGTVRAVFEIDDERLSEIRRQVEQDGVAEPEFEVEVVDESGEIVADVHKTLHVHRSD